MKRFKSIRHAQRFLSAFSGISPHFRPRRHLLSAADYRQVFAVDLVLQRVKPSIQVGLGRPVQRVLQRSDLCRLRQPPGWT